MLWTKVAAWPSQGRAIFMPAIWTTNQKVNPERWNTTAEIVIMAFWEFCATIIIYEKSRAIERENLASMVTNYDFEIS